MSLLYFEPEKITVLENYISLLKEYQKRINLIGKSTMGNIWERHIFDSAQIFRILPKENKNTILVDDGSGAGFPGIVLSIMGRRNVFLCEKNKKKASFLIDVIDKCKLRAFTINERIENIKEKKCSVIVSRAFASLKTLLTRTAHLISKDTVFLLHKGKRYAEEVEETKKIFSFSIKYYDSLTSKEGKILKIQKIKKIRNFI